MKKPNDAKEFADEMLEKWDDICRELGIVNFLVLGTCLGFYRDKGYIPWDDDIDVGVKCNGEAFSRLVHRLMEEGFTTEEEGSPFRYKHFYKNGILFDVWRSSGVDGWKLTSFEEITYNGRVYRVPHPVEKYLELEYGNWRIPDR